MSRKEREDYLREKQMSQGVSWGSEGRYILGRLSRANHEDNSVLSSDCAGIDAADRRTAAVAAQRPIESRELQDAT